MRALLQDRKRNRIAVISGVVFLLIAHLYCWTNEMFNHDSLMIFQNDTGWQISLGRILNPVYLLLRGRIVAPFVIALFGSVFLLSSAVLCVHLLDLKQKVSIILCTGLLVTFETLAYLNATYLFCFDLDMLALLLSVSAVFFLRTGNSFLRWSAAALCCTAALCLYQSYLQVTVTLILLLLLKDLLEETAAKKVLIRGLSSVAVLLCSGILYYAALRLTWHVTGVQPSDRYNGLTQLSSLSLPGLLKQFPKAWFYPFLYFSNSQIAHHTVSSLTYLALLLAFTGMFLFLFFRKKRTPGAMVLAFLILFLLPLGMNFVCLLANGLVHSLMIYSFALFPCAVLMLSDRMDLSRENKLSRLLQAAIPVLCGILVLNHVLFSNQLYLKKHLESKAALSFMTRMTERMEETEGYHAGETKVAIMGWIDLSPLSQERHGYEDLCDPMAGGSHHLAVSYHETYQGYFHFLLGYPIELVPVDDLKIYLEDPRVQSMPVYPEPGSVRMIDDILVIRLSEDLHPEEMHW